MGDPIEPVPCVTEALAPGERLVSPVVCNAQVPSRGDGGRGDWWVANARFRAVISAPEQARTLRGIGGATVIDAAAWEIGDVVHEIVPLVRGGWLEVDRVEPMDDGLRVWGVVRPILPELPVDDGQDGARATLRYRIAADDPWLYLDGAQGVYVHLTGDVETWGEAAFLVDDATLVAAGPRDRAEVVDLGGAVVIGGADRVLVGEPAAGWTAWAGDGAQPVSGQAPGATSVTWFAEGTPRGRAPVNGGRFDLAVPAAITGVRAEADGRAPSDRRAPGVDLDLRLGAPGTLWLRPNAPANVAWTADDGRAGTFLLPPRGDALALGAGRHTLRATAGPAFDPVLLEIDLAPREIATRALRLPARFDPGPWVRLALDQPSDRSRDFRGSDETAAAIAAGEGAAYAVFTPEDLPAGVADPLQLPGEPLEHRSGSTLRGPDWQVWAWPWDDSDQALYGGVQAVGLSALDAAAAATGGPDLERALRVDLGWLEQAGVPFTVHPQPDFVALGPPGADPGEAWAPWFRWLDAGRALVPTGPHTWIPLPAQDQGFSAVDVERPLYRGNVCASTGGIVELTVDGLAPGEVVDEADDHELLVAVRGAAAFTDVRVLGPGGTEVARLPADEAPVAWTGALEPGWVVALAVASDPEPSRWAVTGPVWIGPAP